MGLSDRDYHRESPSQYGGGGSAIFRFSPVVRALFFLNIAVFVVNNIFLANDETRGALMMAGYFSVEKAFGEFQLWRLISYQFLHDGLWHLLLNSIVLYLFGPLVEGLLGRRRFLAFYLLCGIAGAAAMTMISLVPGLLDNVKPASPLIGASGAILGVLAGAAVAYPNLMVQLMIPPIPMKLRTLAMIFIGISVFRVVFGHENAGGEAAHLGGAALGLVLMYNLWLLNFFDAGNRAPVSVRRKPVSASRPVAGRPSTGPKNNDVDRVLDKIAAQGIHSLSAEEKRILEAAREELSKNDR